MSADRHELCIVVPVYNESGAIGAVLSKWSAMLDSHGIDWQLHAYNDGSRDNSSEILSAVAKRSNGRLVAHDKTNSGHGPTILLGYRENAEHCDWLFQMDSDDEMGRKVSRNSGSNEQPMISFSGSATAARNRFPERS